MTRRELEAMDGDELYFTASEVLGESQTVQIMAFPGETARAMVITAILKKAQACPCCHGTGHRPVSVGVGSGKHDVVQKKCESCAQGWRKGVAR